MVGQDIADLSKHTDDELRDGIAAIKDQRPRVAEENSEEASRKQAEQLAAMEAELAKRQR